MRIDACIRANRGCAGAGRGRPRRRARRRMAVCRRRRRIREEDIPVQGEFPPGHGIPRDKAHSAECQAVRREGLRRVPDREGGHRKRAGRIRAAAGVSARCAEIPAAVRGVRVHTRAFTERQGGRFVHEVLRAWRPQRTCRRDIRSVRAGRALPGGGAEQRRRACAHRRVCGASGRDDRDLHAARAAIPAAER